MKFLEQKLSTSDIKNIHEGISFLNEFMNEAITIKDFNILDYSTFGRSFAAFLENYDLAQVYRKFVTQYNKTIQNEFSQDNETINQIAMSVGISGITLRDSFYQKDLTDLFSKNSFKKEAKLEQILYASLTNWTDEWIVKRQQPVGSGISDLTIELEGEKAAIELKKGVAISKDVLQAYGYHMRDSGFDSILIAQNVDDEALKLANDLNIACYGYCLARPVGEEVPECFYLEKMNDVCRNENIQSMFSDIDACGGHIISFFEKRDYIKEYNKSTEKNKTLINNLIRILESQTDGTLKK